MSKVDIYLTCLIAQFAISLAVFTYRGTPVNTLQFWFVVGVGAFFLWSIAYCIKRAIEA